MADQLKDCWDKAEIVSKLLGAVFVPLAVGFVAYLWNVENGRLQSSAAMTQIAISVLNVDPNKISPENDPLRRWAIAVLQAPENPPPLSDDAASQLEKMPLPGFARGGYGIFKIDPTSDLPAPIFPK